MEKEIYIIILFLFMKFFVVYDNLSKGEFKSSWGFSCYIENERKVLFDTGWDGEILLHNLNLAKIDEIDDIVLSHQHWDHIGGLNHVIDKASRVFVPVTFSQNLKKEISRKAEIVENDFVQKICKDMYAVFIKGRIPEQFLVITTTKGVFVVTGCSHPGLDKILNLAEDFGEVYGVIGGFHGFDKIEMLKRYKIVFPCHCTVYKNKILRFDNAKECYAGLSFTIE